MRGEPRPATTTVYVSRPADSVTSSAIELVAVSAGRKVSQDCIWFRRRRSQSSRELDGTPPTQDFASTPDELSGHHGEALWAMSAEAATSVWTGSTDHWCSFEPGRQGRSRGDRNSPDQRLPREILVTSHLNPLIPRQGTAQTQMNRNATRRLSPRSSPLPMPWH